MRSIREGARLTVLQAAGAALRFGGDRGLPLPARPRLLLIRPDHVGDVILTSPAVELIRKALPDAHLTMMVGPWSEEVARRDPMLDEVTTCPFPGFARQGAVSGLAPYRLLREVACEVRDAAFDGALVLRDDHWWGAWLAAQAGVPLRVGHDVDECLPFLNARVPSAGAHWVERSIAVARRALEGSVAAVAPLAATPGLRFGVRQEDEAEATALLAELGIGKDAKLVAVHPGAGSPMKLWPDERWVELGNRLTREGVTVLVTASSSETGLAQGIVAGIPGAASVAGRTDLGTLAALFGRCALVVGTDNGPLHLAVAVDIPSVRLYGPVDPSVYGPWGDTERHVSLTPGPGWTPCGRLDLSPADGSSPACMRAISVDRLFSECTRLLAGASR